MRPARTDIDPDAESHAGRHGEFVIAWFGPRVIDHPSGWYVVCDDAHDANGPFHTSQAAFGAAKDAIDQLIAEGK